MEAVLENQVPVKETKLIRTPSRDLLLKKLDSLKSNNLSAKESGYLSRSIDLNTAVYFQLCWKKFGVSLNQLRNFDPKELEELGNLIYERSRIYGPLQILAHICIPIFGWIVLVYSLIELDRSPEYYIRNEGSACFKNMRYFWWYRRIYRLSGQKFIPNLNLVKK